MTSILGQPHLIHEPFKQVEATKIGFNKYPLPLWKHPLTPTALKWFLLTVVEFSYWQALQHQKNWYFGRIFHKFLGPSKDPKFFFTKCRQKIHLNLIEEMQLHRSTKSLEFFHSHAFSHEFPILDTQYFEWKTFEGLPSIVLGMLSARQNPNGR